MQKEDLLMKIGNIVTDALNSHDGIWVTVHGSSMLPTIKDGQRVFLVSASKYSIGDIIAYRVETPDDVQHIFVHRVIFVRKNYVLTKGDNNSYIDPIKILYDNIIGIVKDIC